MSVSWEGITMKIRLPGQIEMSNYVDRGKRLSLAGARRAMKREIRSRVYRDAEHNKVRASSNLTRSEFVETEEQRIARLDKEIMDHAD